MRMGCVICIQEMVHAVSKILGRKHPFLTQDKPDFDMEAYNETDINQLLRQYIKNGQDGMHAVFRYFDIWELSRIQVAIRGTASGNIETEERGEPIGEIIVRPSENWTTFSGNVKISRGVHELHFFFWGNGTLELLEFTLENKD